MLGVRQHPSNDRRIARELIGDDHARLGAVFAVKHPWQEALGSPLIAALLDQHVQYDAMLIERLATASGVCRGSSAPPRPAAIILSPPRTRRRRSPAAKVCAEVGAPLPDRLVADDDATLGEQLLNVAEADVKTEVQPYGMSDDLGREALASIGRPVSAVGDGHWTRLIADPCPS